MNFNNLNLFNEDIGQIIRSAPDFDILILSNPYEYTFNNMYTRLDQNQLSNLTQIKNILLKKYIPVYVLNIKSLDKIIEKCNSSIKSTIYDPKIMKYVEKSYQIIENMIEYFYLDLDIVVYKYDYFGLDCKKKNNLIMDKFLN